MRKSVMCGLSMSLLTVVCMTVLMAAAAGDTRVADAAMTGDKDTVRTLLTQAADVNAAQGDGMTALHWAALKGDVQLADVLLYAGANVKATTRLGGYTPLYMASKAGSAPVIERLLKAGADPKAAVGLGLTPLMMAASAGDPEAVKLLIKAGADPNAIETERGQTPLSFAAAFNRPDAIKALVANGAKVDLASKVFVPPAPAQRGGGGQGGGGQAAAAGQPGAPAAGAPAAAAAGGGRGGRGGQAPAAAAAGAPAAAAATPAPANAGGGGGRGGRGGGQPAAGAPPADPAAAAAAAAILAGADGAGRGGGNNKGGMTPLMYAARQGYMPAALALLDLGANLNEVSADKSTAVLLATINAHFDMAKLLVERGANVTLVSLDGATPLYGVVNTQWARHSVYPQPKPWSDKTTHLELMTLMLDRGADPNLRLAKELWYSEYNFSLLSATAAGTTPFWKCAEVGDIDCMRLLVSRGADPRIPSREGVTPLLIASGAGAHGNDDVTAAPGRLSAVKYLIEELGADVNESDTGPPVPAAPPQVAAAPAPAAAAGAPGTPAAPPAQQFGGRGRGGGVTALHNAATRGDNEMILYLVSKGAKVDVLSNAGASVADYANGPRQRIQPYPETVALLEMLGSKNHHKCVSC